MIPIDEGASRFRIRNRLKQAPAAEGAILLLSGLTREHDSNRNNFLKATSHPEAMMNPLLVSPMCEHRRFRSKSGFGVIRTIHRFAVAALVLTTACGTFSKIEDPLEPNTTPAATQVDISAVAARQIELEATAQEIHAQLAEFHKAAGWRQRGYFSSSEHDDIEWLFFRYVQNHRAFWGEIDRLGGVDLALTADAEHPGAHLLVLHAGLALADASTFLVAEFQADPVAVAKLNESFYRSEIPADTYEKIALSATDAKRRKALAKAWALHEKDSSDPNSSAVAACILNPELTPILASLAPLWARVATQSKQIDPSRDRILTDLDHGLAAESTRASDRSIDALAYETRALVFKDVSRIKDPAARLIKFSAAQKQELHRLLSPGDILLSYTAGYISDVFIPGTFKHGITYVGVEAEREAAGLTMASLPELDRSRTDQFRVDIADDRMSDGSKADLIEAVDAFLEGRDLVPGPAETLADSICVGHPRNWRKALTAARDSGGAFVAVSDDQILEAMREAGRLAGLFGEPAGVAGLAGLKQAVGEEVVGRRETALAVVTGSGLKDVRSATRAAGGPIELAADDAALDGHLEEYPLSPGR